MSDLFISYARKDRPRAENFARALQTHGWSVFWDPTIRAGSNFRETIAVELQLACCVLVLWSKESVKSDWVLDEADEDLGGMYEKGDGVSKNLDLACQYYLKGDQNNADVQAGVSRVCRNGGKSKKK